MSWTVFAVGEAANERAEALLIDRLRAVMTSLSTGATTAVVDTDHHGRVDLLDRNGYSRDETAPR